MKTPDEAQTYQRLWGELPPGYTLEAGQAEVERRHVEDTAGAMLCAIPASARTGDAVHATATDKGCGTLFADGRQA